MLSTFTHLWVHILIVPTLGDPLGLSHRPCGIYLSCPGRRFYLSTDSHSEHLKDNLVSEFSCYLTELQAFRRYSVKELRSSRINPVSFI